MGFAYEINKSTKHKVFYESKKKKDNNSQKTFRCAGEWSVIWPRAIRLQSLARPWPLSRATYGMIWEFRQDLIEEPIGCLMNLKVDWLIDWLTDVSISSTDTKLDFSLISSDDEGNDDEDVSFSEPPLDDEDDEPLTRPSSGFTPSPQPLTSTQKPRERNSDDEKASEKKGQGRIILKFRFNFCNLC